MIAAGPSDSVEKTAAVKDSGLVMPDSEKTPVEYADGIFTGESPEWTGMKVQVHIEDGRIKQVKVLKAKGTPEYYDAVVRKMPRSIVKTGSVEVDSITGATLSSDSLKKAVREALKKAVKT